MREVTCLSSRIFVWPGVHAEVGETVRVLARDVSKAVILTDRNCTRYAERVELGLQQSRIEVEMVTLPSGEKQKRLGTAERVYDRMAKAKLDRRSVLVAVGGGVISDLGGFVASTWMRGIGLFLVPTTFLAQVDAAIGGKTAVNLPDGKNLVGTFYQPKAVFADPTTLHSLPPREYKTGLAEVVKYGMIQDAELLTYLDRHITAIRDRNAHILEEIVSRCATIKASIVEQDERESGLRATLNYGHTIGHALEAAGGFRGLHHGEAVSIGMEAEAVIAMEMGITNMDTLAVQNRILKRCGLPTRLKKRLSTDRILAAMSLDKKGVAGRPRFVLPEAVGRVRFPVEVPPELIIAALRTVTA